MSGAEQLARQLPEVHTVPAPHAVPALPPATPQPAVAPQLVGLVAESMQTPPQLICDPGQDT